MFSFFLVAALVEVQSVVVTTSTTASVVATSATASFCLAQVYSATTLVIVATGLCFFFLFLAQVVSATAIFSLAEVA